MALDEQQNQVGVEIFADPSNAEARIEGFVREVANADRVMQQAGRGGAFGEEYARQTEKAQVAIAQATKAATDSGIAIDRSYARGQQAAERLTDATQAIKVTTEEVAKAAEAAQIPIVRAYEQGADAARKYVTETEKAREVQGPSPEAVEAAQIPIVRAYEQGTEAARKYVAEAQKAQQIQGANSLPPLTPLTPEQKRERRPEPELNTTFAQFEAAAAARERLAEADVRASASAQKLQAEEDRLSASLATTNDKAGELTTGFHRLAETKFGDALSAQVQKAELRLAQTRARVQELSREVEKPPQERKITDIGHKAEVAGRRIERLTGELRELEKEAAKADRATNRVGDGRGGRRDIRGVATAAGYAGAELGIPGLGSLTSAATIGGPAAAIGGAAVVAGGLIAGVKAARDLEKAQLDLAVSSRDTGRSYAEATANADAFHNSLSVNREEALKVAAAYGELQLKSGEAFNTADAEKLATLATARGLDAEKTAAVLQGLARGSSEAFEQLAGSRADITLDRYAKSINRTVSELTDMERVQALTSAAVRESAEDAALAARRVETLDGKWQSFKKGLSDFASTAGETFISAFVLNETAEQAYQRKLEELGANRVNQDVARENKRKAEEQEHKRQQEANRELTRSIADSERAARALPEDYGSGLTSAQRQEVELKRLRENLAATERAYEAFQKRKDQFSSDDAKTRDDQFQDKRQSQIDQVRAANERAAEAERAANEQITQAVRAARKEALGFVDDIAARTEAQGNPFIKLFSAGETAAERMQERFGALGDEVVARFTEMERKAVEFETSTQRLQHDLKAVELEFKAEQLQKPLVGLTGEMERQVAILNRQLEAAQKVPELLGSADALRRGRASEEEGLQPREGRINDEQYNNLIGLSRRYEDAPQAVRNAIDSQLTGFFERLKPGEQRSVAQGDTAPLARSRDEFAAAFERQAVFQQRQIEEEVKRAEASRAIVDLANRKLAQLSQDAPGLDENTLRKEFIAITQGLDPKELSGELRQGIVAAFKEEAQHERELEQEARVFRQQLVGQGGLLAQIKTVVENQGKEVSKALSTNEVNKLGTAVQSNTQPAYTSKESYREPYEVEQGESRAALTNYPPTTQGYDPAINQIAINKKYGAYGNPNPAGYDPAINQIAINKKYGAYGNPNPAGYDPAINQIAPTRDSGYDPAINQIAINKKYGAYGNPNPDGYDPAINQIRPRVPENAVQMLARKEREEAYSRDIERARAQNPVNPYSQAFLRARPGYSAANDPKPFDPTNPYQESFLRAGYLPALRSSEPHRSQERAQPEMKEMRDLLKQLVEATKARLDKLEIEIIDKSNAARTSVRGRGYQ